MSEAIPKALKCEVTLEPHSPVILFSYFFWYAFKHERFEFCCKPFSLNPYEVQHLIIPLNNALHAHLLVQPAACILDPQIKSYRDIKLVWIFNMTSDSSYKIDSVSDLGTQDWAGNVSLWRCKRQLSGSVPDVAVTTSVSRAGDLLFNWWTSNSKSMLYRL